jgi:GT2 family glycosyltransferase
MKIAVLITCHNRESTTKKSLNALYDSVNNDRFTLDVFLVDDGSTDNTSQMVKTNFPKINLIEGSGNLYWNKGMRLAWEIANETDNYDFFVWLNDDTIVDNSSIDQLLDCYLEYKDQTQKESIIIGSIRNDNKSNNFSYGLRSDNKKIIPNNFLQFGNLCNGNLVLISKSVFFKLGYLSENYTHSMGDYDYGLRAIENGINLLSSKTYLATCPLNIGIAIWCNPKYKLIDRWNSFHSPLGLNIKEYKYFVRRFNSNKYFLVILNVYLKCLFPSIFKIFNKI